MAKPESSNEANKQQPQNAEAQASAQQPAKPTPPEMVRIKCGKSEEKGEIRVKYERDK